MDKKQYVIKALEATKDTWDLARAWLIIINKIDVDENILDIIIRTIDSSIQQIEETNIKNKLENIKNYMEKIKETEKLSQTQDEEYLSNVDNILI